MAVTLTVDSTVVTLTVVKFVSPVVTKNLQMIETVSGTVPKDEGRSGDKISISGTQTTTAYADIHQLNSFMDAGSEVELEGMEDSNHDGQYYIRSLDFNAEAGYPSNMYDFNIDLERARD